MPERGLPHSIEGASSVDWGEDASHEREKAPDTEPVPDTEQAPAPESATVKIDVTPKDEFALSPMDLVPPSTTGETLDEMRERGEQRQELAQMRSRVEALHEQARPSDTLGGEEPEPATLPSSGVRRVMDRLAAEPVSEEEAPPTSREPISSERGGRFEVVGKGRVPATEETAPSVPSVIEDGEDEAA